MSEWIEVRTTTAGQYTAWARGTLCTGLGSSAEEALYDLAKQLLALVERQRHPLLVLHRKVGELTEQLALKT